MYLKIVGISLEQDLHCRVLIMPKVAVYYFTNIPYFFKIKTFISIQIHLRGCPSQCTLLSNIWVRVVFELNILFIVIALKTSYIWQLACPGMGQSRDSAPVFVMQIPKFLAKIGILCIGKGNNVLSHVVPIVSRLILIHFNDILNCQLTLLYQIPFMSSIYSPTHICLFVKVISRNINTK